MTSYVIATIKPWNIAAFNKIEAPGDWHLVDDPSGLTIEGIQALKPRYVFFPHWSWKVPPPVLYLAECVCFHMTDVPYGRGGSPLQNLIVRGHTETVVSALRMTEEMDAGPVYMKAPLSLAGSAQEIFERSAGVVFGMIEAIAKSEPIPVPQSGEPTIFKRRAPQQSELPKEGELASVYDFIRMLDAETYPPAFIEWGLYRIEFHDAMLDGDSVRSKVTIKQK